MWIEIFNEVEAKSAIVALGGAESWYPDMTLLSSVDDRTYIDSVRHHHRAVRYLCLTGLRCAATSLPRTTTTRRWIWQ